MTKIRRLVRLQASYIFRQFVEEIKLRWTQAILENRVTKKSNRVILGLCLEETHPR